MSKIFPELAVTTQEVEIYLPKKNKTGTTYQFRNQTTVSRHEFILLLVQADRFFTPRNSDKSYYYFVPLIELLKGTIPLSVFRWTKNYKLLPQIGSDKFIKWEAWIGQRTPAINSELPVLGTE